MKLRLAIEKRRSFAWRRVSRNLGDTILFTNSFSKCISNIVWTSQVAQLQAELQDQSSCGFSLDSCKLSR